MWFYQKQKFESNKRTENIWEFIEKNKDTINQQLRKGILLKIGGFHLHLNKVKKEVKICRLNPLWGYTIVKICPNAKGSILEIKSTPQPFYCYIFLGLLTILLITTAYLTKEILFLLMIYLGFLLVGTVNLIIKRYNFLILLNFCKTNLISER